MYSDMLAFQPPEILAQEPKHQHQWSHDIFSLGVVLIEICTGFPVDTKDCNSKFQVDFNYKMMTIYKKTKLGQGAFHTKQNDDDPLEAMLKA